MLSAIWHTAIYAPLYNLLMLFVAVLPGHSVGGAIILLTATVKGVLYPLAQKGIIAQRAMRELEPKIKEIRERHKEDKVQVAQKTMELYQKEGVTPFSGCLPLLIQIPIIIALYWTFFKGLSITPEYFYSFVPIPEELDMDFLVFDLAAKSIFLACAAGFTQYIQADLSLGNQKEDNTKPKQTSDKPSFQEDFQKSMQFQMRYIFPIMISFIAYTTSAAVALYWVTSNIFSIAQELHARRQKQP
jgi:YidC/Oxa1 family membrane protein insertase